MHASCEVNISTFIEISCENVTDFLKNVLCISLLSQSKTFECLLEVYSSVLPLLRAQSFLVSFLSSRGHQRTIIQSFLDYLILLFRNLENSNTSFGVRKGIADPNMNMIHSTAATVMTLNSIKARISVPLGFPIFQMGKLCLGLVIHGYV